jgi:hypothetical protein
MVNKLFFSVYILGASNILLCQGFWKTKPKKPKTIVKTGPYIGVESGRYYVGEVGMERQWKEGKLIGPNTHALYFGVNYTYDFSRFNPVLGYDIGYWFRNNNIGMTFGGSICMRSNFYDYRFGFTPTIGYKIWQLHIQTGYHFLYPFYVVDNSTFDSNTLFLSARFVLVNDREVKQKD